MSLTKLGLRTVYKLENGIDFLKEEHHTKYIHWLENLLVNSDVNTINGIKKIVSFEDKCPFCGNNTYSTTQEICITEGCFAFF